MLICIFVLHIWFAFSQPLPADPGIPKPDNFDELDCCIRKFALDYGLHRVADAGAVENETSVNISLFEALRLHKCTGFQCPSPPLPYKTVSSRAPPQNGIEIHVSVASGDDKNPGTENKPLRTLERAQKVLRQMKKPNIVATVWIHAGVYSLSRCF